MLSDDAHYLAQAVRVVQVVLAHAGQRLNFAKEKIYMVTHLLLIRAVKVHNCSLLSLQLLLLDAARLSDEEHVADFFRHKFGHLLSDMWVLEMVMVDDTRVARRRHEALVISNVRHAREMGQCVVGMLYHGARRHALRYFRLVEVRRTCI